MAGFADKEKLRKKLFKKDLETDEPRRRREEVAIQIRKNKREENLNQRRRTGKQVKTASVVDYHIPGLFLVTCIN